MTREHVIPRWTHDIDAIAGSYAVNRPSAGKLRRLAGSTVEVRKNGVVVGPVRRYAKQKAIHPVHTTTAVCNTCNSGWMATLEDQVKPHLFPLINGTTVVIPSAASETLIRWAVKTAIAFEQDDPQSAAIRPAQIRDVVAARHPRWVNVYTSRWRDPTDVMLRHSWRQLAGKHPRGTWSGSAEGGSATFLALGHVTFYVDAAPDFGVEFAQAGKPPGPWKRIASGQSLELDLGVVTREDVEQFLPF